MPSYLGFVQLGGKDLWFLAECHSVLLNVRKHYIGQDCCRSLSHNPRASKALSIMLSRSYL